MKEAERTLLFSEFVMNKSKKLIKPSEMLFIFTDFKYDTYSCDIRCIDTIKFLTVLLNLTTE